MVTVLSAGGKIVSNLVKSENAGKKKKTKKKNFIRRWCCFPQKEEEKESEHCEDHVRDRSIRVNLACCSKTYSTSSKSLHYKVDERCRYQ